MESLPRSLTHPIITLRPSECSIMNEENKYVFVGKVYDTYNINKDILKVNEFLENFSVCNEKELLNDENENGIYTWIIYSEENSSDIKFMATKVLSPYEIGTTHQSIAYNKRVNANLIYGAGELKKKDNLIIFNLISGTYTKRLIKYNFDDKIKNQIISKFKEFFNSTNLYKIEYDERYQSDDSYIQNIVTVSNKLLELYKSINYIVKIFDILNNCVVYNNNFWHIDWSIEYYKKKLDSANESEKDLMQKLYKESLESMNNLIKIDN